MPSTVFKREREFHFLSTNGNIHIVNMFDQIFDINLRTLVDKVSGFTAGSQDASVKKEKKPCKLLHV